MKTRNLIVASLLVLSTSGAALAQSTTVASTPAAQDKGPEELNIDPMIIVDTIIGRIHRVYGGIQNVRDVMKGSGATTFRDVYGVEGSLVNDTDMGCTEFRCYESIDEEAHGIGYHVLPYELHMTRDGYFAGRVAIFGAKSLNSKQDNGAAEKVINSFRVLEFEWDVDRDDINKFRLKAGELDLRLGLFNKNGSWVSLNLGFGIGYERRNLPSSVGQAVDGEGRKFTGGQNFFFLDGRAGIEFHKAFGTAWSLHGSTMYSLTGLFGASNFKQPVQDKDGNSKTYEDVLGTTGLRTALISQVELNYHMNTGHKSYKSSAGVYIQSQNLQRNVMSRGNEHINVGAHDRDAGGDVYTAGFQLKW